MFLYVKTHTSVNAYMIIYVDFSPN